METTAKQINSVNLALQGLISWWSQVEGLENKKLTFEVDPNATNDDIDTPGKEEGPGNKQPTGEKNPTKENPPISDLKIGTRYKYKNPGRDNEYAALKLTEIKDDGTHVFSSMSAGSWNASVELSREEVDKLLSAETRK
jgi:hypothetical protein